MTSDDGAASAATSATGDGGGAGFSGEGRHIELPGRGTTFVREMTGPPGAPVVLLLHGLGVTAGINWGPSMPALAEHYRVLAMDLRGHGRGISTCSFSLGDCADDAIAVLDVLDIDHVIVAGYSMGGPVSQLMARQYPDRVIGLVQCATATRFIDPMVQNAAVTVGALSAIGSHIPQRIREGLTRFVWRGGPRPSSGVVLDELRRTSQLSLVQASLATSLFNSTPWFRELHHPVSAVVTLYDAVVPAYRQLRLVAGKPDHTVHIVEADHMACVRRPERFAPQLVLACHSVALRGGVRPRAVPVIDAPSAADDGGES